MREHLLECAACERIEREAARDQVARFWKSLFYGIASNFLTCGHGRVEGQRTEQVRRADVLLQ